ncbi:hypothetical protein PO909_018506 [Leuciscus waleckii]
MCNMESHLLSLEYFFRRHQTPQELWRTVITTSTHWHFQFHTTNGERRVMFWSGAGSFSWVFMYREDVPWSTREADRVADPCVRSMTGGKRK